MDFHLGGGRSKGVVHLVSAPASADTEDWLRVIPNFRRDVP